MASSEFKIEGLDVVLKKMRALPVDVGAKGARYAGRKAANLIRDAAIQNASKLNDPATREEIAKNISVRFSSRLFRRTGDIGFRVGIMGGARQYANTRENRRKRRVGKNWAGAGEFVSLTMPGGDTFYWRFLEFGTQKIAARPFMRPALANNVSAATTEFTTQLNRWLDRYFRRKGVAPPDL